MNIINIVKRVNLLGSVKLTGISKEFIDDDGSKITAVDNLDLTINDGEFFTLLGPSGCGKTTILRMLAGFENPSEGKIEINNRDITDLSASKRDVGIVFQNYALFPHMSVFENIAFGLKVKKMAADKVKERVNEMLRIVKMEDYGSRKPSALSGGQQQRIAIARSLAPNPPILLLDEPLSNLDAKLREETREELIDLHRRLGVIIIYVTHDQEEALAISDRILVLDKGLKQEVGTPYELYETPQTRFVADFLGNTNLLDGDLISDNIFKTDQGSEIKIDSINSSKKISSLGIKPEKVILEPEIDKVDTILEGEILVAQYLGDRISFHLKLESGEKLKSHLEPNENLIDLERGSQVKVGFRTKDLRLLEAGE